MRLAKRDFPEKDNGHGDSSWRDAAIVHAPVRWSIGYVPNERIRHGKEDWGFDQRAWPGDSGSFRPRSTDQENRVESRSRGTASGWTQRSDKEIEWREERNWAEGKWLEREVRSIGEEFQGHGREVRSQSHQSWWAWRAADEERAEGVEAWAWPPRRQRDTQASNTITRWSQQRDNYVQRSERGRQNCALSSKWSIPGDRDQTPSGQGCRSRSKE